MSAGLRYVWETETDAVYYHAGDLAAWLLDLAAVAEPDSPPADICTFLAGAIIRTAEMPRTNATLPIDGQIFHVEEP